MAERHEPMFCYVLRWGAAVLTVSLLGASRVTRGNEQIWLDLGPAGRRLAGFLFTFPDRPHRRERLIDLFWPELDTERGRRAVNSAVWRLRKLLASAPEYREGHGLRTVGPETILERTPWLDVDTWALLEVAQGALGGAEAPVEPSRMKQILAVLYRYEGPFLDGEDAEWILEERERLHSLFVQSAMIVVRHFGLCGHYHDAILLARHVLRFDPFTSARITAFPPFDPARGAIYRECAGKAMRLWRSIFGFGSMVFGLALFNALGHPEYYLLLRLVGLNLFFYAYLRPAQRRASRMAFERMGLKSPRTFDGASGFGSQMSMWLGPPWR